MKQFCTYMLLLGCFVANAGAAETHYQSKDISFPGAAGDSLSGTLTLPNGKGPFPAIVLLGGSERLDRTGIYNWANADAFVEHGIAVFSFDSPGRGKSEGNRWGRTHEERTSDALAAIRALESRRDIIEESVGLYGVSEGGVITFRAASLSKGVAFAVTISAPAVPFESNVDNKVKTLCLLSGLQGEPLDKLVTFNRLTVALARGSNMIDAIDLKKTVEDWNDPKWKKLISLLEKQSKVNREATRDAFIEIAKKWESTDWFQRNKKLRELQTPLLQLMGFDLSDLDAELDEPVTARSLVEFDSAVLAKISVSDSPNAMLMTADPSREDDPVTFLMKITCPVLCIYGEKDHDMSTYPKIVRDVFSSTKHGDSTVRVLEDAGHQLEVTNGKLVTGRALRKYRHKEVDPLILDWIVKRLPATP
jgi:pimeloyl-ACP methyl ester carboxylesterase